MKTMVCEICGSNEIVKQVEFFVCQSCGTKYTAETAKALLVEGTVKIDKTDNEQNLRDIAQQALDAKDYESAARYYEELLKMNARDWEAIFYRLYARVMKAEYDELNKTIILLNNSLEGLKKAILPHQEQLERVKIVTQISFSICELCLHLKSIAHDIYNNGLEDRALLLSGVNSEYLSAHRDEDYGVRLEEISKILLIWGEIQAELLDEHLNDEQKSKLYTTIWDLGISLYVNAFYVKDQLNITCIDKETLTSLKYYASLLKKYNSKYKNPFISQAEYNHKIAESIKEHLYVDDPIVYNSATGRELNYSQWKRQQVANTNPSAQSYSSSVSSTPQPQEENKTGKIIWGIIGGIIFGLIYFVCCS